MSTVRSSRSPHGERGLKSYAADNITADGESLPPRGAWIEILTGINQLDLSADSLEYLKLFSRL